MSLKRLYESVGAPTVGTYAWIRLQSGSVTVAVLSQYGWMICGSEVEVEQDDAEVIQVIPPPQGVDPQEIRQS